MHGQVERLDASSHREAARLVETLAPQLDGNPLLAIGHRIVFGGLQDQEHQLIMPALLDALRESIPLDRTHLPAEIELIVACGASFPGVPQVACFDTAFHRELPRVAKLLPIPRRYDERGLRRMGFHGLSFTYLMDELRRTAGAEVANGRVILAHLGSGASMAAVHEGRPIDTTMGLTPTAGLVMGRRPGDLDPGLIMYLMREEKLSPAEMEDFINQRCGLLGVSETSSDMRDLIRCRVNDVRAAEAVELFCYQARKFVGSLAAALGGLDTLVFAGGIGEHSHEVRDEICRGLEFLGIRLNPLRNEASAALISEDDSRVAVRVIATDEEAVIARAVCRVIRTASTANTRPSK
jgi:acetate kinase